MNKRADAIRSMFTAKPPEAAATDAPSPAPPQRVAAGSVRAMKESFVGIEKENEELRELMAAGARILELDPDVIDPAPVADRFPDDEDSFALLKASIAAHGQEVPILVREHPSRRGRFQVAYGHRRLRAAQELDRKVRAVVRSLSDSELVIAQGLENSARQDLTFIERAAFARRLEDAGHARTVIQEALAIDRAEASKLIAVARAVPNDVMEAIGRAPKAGRGRWLTLSERLTDPDAVLRVRSALAAASALGTDARFGKALAAAAREEPASPAAGAGQVVLAGPNGEALVNLTTAGREARLAIDMVRAADFHSFLIERLPGLYAEHLARRGTAKR